MSAGKVTISDVARRAGVSKGLVSFAFNDRPGVSPQSRQRILEIAQDMGWRPDSRARALSTSRSLAYGLVLSRNPRVLSSDSFFPTFIAGVERALSELGHVLVLSVVDDPARELATYRSLLETGRVDGVFLTDVRRDDPRIALVRELDAPAVILGDPETAPRIPAIGISENAAADDLIEHLASLGHREIGLVGGPDHMLHAGLWRDTLRDAMRRRGLPGARAIETDFSAEMGVEATQELLAHPRPPTAIIYANDHMALAALGYARRAGVDVPRDLSVVGHGDNDMTRFAYPTLTTISVDIAEWGYRAALVLTRQVAGEPIDVGAMPPARLEVRESTGTAP